jgi:Mrp family chromosome partitioning ATPase
MMALLGFTAGLLAAAAAVVEGLRPGEGPPDGGALGAGTGRHELPAGPNAFVGRRVEIARALQLLRRRRDGAPAATITGMPGVGKTALALVLAHHLARTEYPDDQLFISLDSRLPVSPADALYDRLLAFGVPSAKIPGDLDGRRKLYLDALHGRRALVVLDDVTTAEQVRALWPPSGCAAIVTGSVELLEIFKDGAETLRLQPLTTLEAMRFLTNRIGRRRVVREPLAALRIVPAAACRSHWPALPRI